MIEADIVSLLQGNSEITTPLGGVGKVYYIQPSANASMPYLYVEAANGTPTKMGANKQEVVASVRITLGISQANVVKGRTIMESVKDTLQGVRGDATESKDLYITCSDVSSYAGVSGTAVFVLTCSCKFIEDWSTQHI